MRRDILRAFARAAVCARAGRRAASWYLSARFSASLRVHGRVRALCLRTGGGGGPPSAGFWRCHAPPSRPRALAGTW